jgi:hypothetical protein
LALSIRRSITDYEVVDALVAAIVGAVVGAVIGAAVSFFLQSRGYKLALEQDRRNQRRQRWTDAIIEAGSALDGRGRTERISAEEFETWKTSLPADSIAAQNAERHYDLRPFNDAVSRAMWTLQLHLGKDHWLNEKYLDAAVECAAAEEAKSEHFRSTDENWRIENIPTLNEILVQAAEAREDWMGLARDEIESI